MSEWIKAVISNLKLTEDEKISNMKFTKNDLKYISIKFSSQPLPPPPTIN